jgi:hypothetical protein
MTQSTSYKYKEFLVAFIIACIFLPVKYNVIFVTPTDYQLHIGDAAKYFETLQFFGAPHFLFEALVIFAKVVFRVSWLAAGLIVDIAFYFILAKLLLHEFNTLELNFKLRISTVLLLMISWPLFLFYFVDHKFYGGYIGTNVFHNPTMVLLKPLALFVHLKVVKSLVAKQWSFSIRRSLWIAIVMILATLAKPNYAIVLLPALGILFLLLRGNLRVAPWRQIVLFVILPVVILLAIQFLMHFNNGLVAGKSDRGIIFAPFVVFGMYSRFLFPKFLLAMAFPLAVATTFFKNASADLRLKFAWLCFLIGSFYTYFLAESGSDMSAGNFGWSSQISLFILFVESAIFLLDSNRRGVTDRGKLVYGVLVLHGIAGIIAYLNVDKIN